MAVVGTAFVRLRVIGDKLKKDIGDSVQAAVDKAAPDLDHAGKDIGEKVSKSTGKEVERSLGSSLGQISDSIGDQIGRRMANNMGRSLRANLGRTLRSSFDRVRPVVAKAGDKLGSAFSSFQRRIEKSMKGGKGGIGGLLIAGIGAAITVLPSLLAGAGAIVGAYLATVVTAIAALGPAAAGAALGAVSAFSAIKISAGLIGLAMKTPSAALDDFKKRSAQFKALIGKPIQVGLFSGLNASMRILGPVVTALRPQLTALGTIVGDLAIGFADAVRQGVMMDRIGRILSTNNEFVRLAGGGLSALGQAFIVLLDHLSPVTLAIGEMIGQFGQWALATINAASASGVLDSWITRMWSSFLRLSGIVVDFGIGLYNVFTAAQPAAGNLTTSLENIGRRFREWTGDEANQARMTIFFEKMRTIVAEVNSILGDLVSSGLKALEGTDVTSLTNGLETLRSLGAPIAQMFNSIKDAAGKDLLNTFQSFADMITELANSGVVGMLASAFGNLFEAITGLLSIPGVGTILSFVAGLAVLGKTVMLILGVFNMLMGGLRPVILIFRIIAWAVGILIGAFGFIPVAIAAIVGALIYFFAFTDTGRAIILAIWNAIKAGISAAIDGIVAAFHWVMGVLGTVWDFIVGAAQGIWNAISTAFTAVVDTVVSVFTTVRDFIIGVWNAIWGFIQPILQGIWGFISAVFEGIKTAIQTAINIIYEIWIRIWPLLMLPIRVLYGVILFVFGAIWEFIKFVFQAIWDFVLMVWNGIVTGVTWALDRLWTGIQNIWNAIWGFIQPIIQGIWDFIVGAFEAIVSGVTGFLDRLWTGIQNIWNAVWGFIQPILNRIGSFISGVWNGIVDGVMGFLDRLWRGVQNIWNSITDFIQTAMDTIGGIISGVWDFLGGVGEGVLSGLKAAVNTVINAINTVIGGINWAIDTANKLPGADIPTIPKIPRLAKGGVVSPRGGGSLAMIAEAGRPERVEPLDPQGLSKRDRALIELLAGGSGSGTEVRVFIGDRELTDIIDVVVEDREDSLANRVLVGTK